MAMINNASGVYSTLGYSFNDPNGDILELSKKTQEHMNSMPAFIDAWQAKDIANGESNGYFQNPASANVNLIITVAQNLKSTANAGSSANISGCELIESAANSLQSVAESFLSHTDRLSGVVPFVGQDVVNPYYETAMGLGKTALYITNQTDGITNTSPILGSFTSILVVPQIGTEGNKLSADLIILTSGVSANNLTEQQITQITSSIVSTSSFLTTRQNADISYFANLRTFVDNYNVVKQFSNMGESQTFLINNFIGTPKLLTRINQ